MRNGADFQEQEMDRLVRSLFLSVENLEMDLPDSTIERLLDEAGEEPLSGEANKRMVSSLLEKRKARTIDIARQQVEPKNMSLGRFAERVRSKSDLSVRVFAGLLKLGEPVYQQIEGDKVPINRIGTPDLVKLMKNMNVQWGDFLSLLKHSLLLQQQRGKQITGLARADKRNRDSGALAQAMEDLMTVSHRASGGSLPELDTDFLNRLREEASRQGMKVT